MNFINRMTTVVCLLSGAYGMYSGWSFREFIAFFLIGSALDYFFNAFTAKPENE